MSKYKQYPLRIRIFRKIYPLIELLPFGLYKKIAHFYFFFPLKYPIPDVEKQCLLKAKTFNYPFENQLIKSYMWGSGKSDKKILLVHGWAGRASQFRSIIDSLLDRYEVYSFDAPGHGFSDGETSNMLEMAAISQKICQEFGIKTVIGHSLGGAASVYLCSVLGQEMEKLVLLSAPASGKNMLDDFMDKINGGNKTKNYIKEICYQKFNKELDDFFAENILPTLNFPKTLAIHDSHDYEVRFSNLEILENKIADIETFTTENLGHTKILRDKMVLERIKVFLGK
jgi:pimeloyl-ACP methyl ester carboxylesterase